MDVKFFFLLGAALLLWLATRLVKKKKGLHSFFVVILSIFVTLVVIETAWRFLLKKNATTIKSNKNFGAYASHPLTGFMIADAGEMNVTKEARNGDVIFNTTYTLIPDSGSNNIHMNHRIGYHAPGNDSAELVFLGCSITYGEGIHDQETFAFKTGELCHLSSLNYGFSGFGTHQAYNIYLNKYLQANDHKKRVFIYSFIPDHILRAKCVYPWNINDPFFDWQSDSLVLKGKASGYSGFAKTHKYTRYLSLFNSFTFITDIETSVVASRAARSLQPSDYTRVFWMLKKMEESMTGRGDKLVLLYWDKYKWKETDDSQVLNKSLIEESINSLAKEGVIVIRASSIFDINNPDFFIKGDGHPNAKAAGLVAQKLSQVVCEH